MEHKNYLNSYFKTMMLLHSSKATSTYVFKAGKAKLVKLSKNDNYKHFKQVFVVCWSSELMAA